MTGDYSPRPAPSWPKVIATTFRLWAGRRLYKLRARRRLYGRLGVGLLALMALAGAATSVALAHANSSSAQASTRPSGVARNAGHSSAPPGATALAAASETRQAATAWVAAQVDHGIIVACDPLTCAALHQQGFPAADLSVIDAESADPLGSAVVVATPTVRDQLGPRLASVYAPLVIATFGAGADEIQVRVTAVGGATAFLSALQSDRQARKVTGRQLAGNRHFHAAALARSEVTSGRVDSRLLITLAALTHKFSVQVREFSDSGPGTGTTGELREVSIIAPTTRYLSQLLTFLRAQRPPLRASISENHDGPITVVHIQFTAPSIPGLLHVKAPS